MRVLAHVETVSEPDLSLAVAQLLARVIMQSATLVCGDAGNEETQQSNNEHSSKKPQSYSKLLLLLQRWLQKEKLFCGDYCIVSASSGRGKLRALIILGRRYLIFKKMIYSFSDI